eukprot:Hpha_TRINITY_DN14628_c0_g5::TRINITY_DN14628_c0_g5_i1::g.47737::m.47737
MGCCKSDMRPPEEVPARHRPLPSPKVFQEPPVCHLSVGDKVILRSCVRSQPGEVLIHGEEGIVIADAVAVVADRYRVRGPRGDDAVFSGADLCRADQDSAARQAAARACSAWDASAFQLN